MNCEERLIAMQTELTEVKTQLQSVWLYGQAIFNRVGPLESKIDSLVSQSSNTNDQGLIDSINQIKTFLGLEVT